MSKAFRIFGGLGLAGLLLGLAIGVYAFTASNTVPASNAGDGNSEIDGYNVTNIHYGLNGTNPNQIDNVQFFLTPKTPGATNATSVTIKVGTHAYTSVGSGATCTASGQTWTCTTAGLDAGSPTNFEVTAAQ